MIYCSLIDAYIRQDDKCINCEYYDELNDDCTKEEKKNDC